MPAKWTAEKIHALKGKQKIPVLTAYDCMTARLIDEADIPAILVGDSLGMTVLGYDTTLPVTMDDMLHHTAAVVRGVKSALVIGDMPFLSYQGRIDDAVSNAGRFLKEAGADAVKIEGGAIRAELVRTLLKNGIPVMGHIGLTPQSVRAMGGYKVQGRDERTAAQLLEDARALDEAGVFSLVIEGVPADRAADITAAVSAPTIGIGAGRQCDGQVLVVQDMLGMTPDLHPKFVKTFAQLGRDMQNAFAEYKREVEEGAFPGPEHEY